MADAQPRLVITNKQTFCQPSRLMSVYDPLRTLDVAVTSPVMTDYRAETASEPKLQAWLHPEEPGWRLVVEYVDPSIRHEPVRSTWMKTLIEALEQMNMYWPEPPVWTRLDTGEVVDLGGLTGYVWENVARFI